MTEVSVKPRPPFGLWRACGLSEVGLRDLASALQRLFAGLEEAWRAATPHIEAIENAIDRLRAAPRIKGYEEHLRCNGLGPEEAQMMAQITLPLGAKYHAERIANRKLASAVGELARLARATSLVVSRRAKRLSKSLEDGLALSHLGEAFLAAGIPDEECDFGALVDEAMSRSSEACARLTALCQRLKPHLDDPRGKVPTIQSTTHELLLLSAMVSGSADSYEDPATRGTREHFNDFDFDPRPAQRRVRKLMRGTSRGGARRQAGSRCVLKT